MIGWLMRLWWDETHRHQRELAEARRQLRHSPDSCPHGAWAAERCFFCEVSE